MLTIIFAAFFLSAANVAGHMHKTPISVVSSRQTSSQTNTSDCNALCRKFLSLKQECQVPHCGCSIGFVQMQGACLLCGAATPEAAANVQFLLDEEMAQCHSEGIKIEYRLPLPPDALAIVNENYRQTEQLQLRQTIFLALEIAGGHVGLVIVVIFAVFSPKGNRNVTFFNFCITWIFSSVFICFMLYRGIHEHTIINPLGEVSPAVCLTQAALINGAQAMTACSAMLFVMQLWISLHASLNRGPTSLDGNKLSWILILVSPPYIVFSGFATAGFLIGNHSLDTPEGRSAQRTVVTKFYCTIYDEAFVRAVYGMTLGFLVITVVFDILIVRIVYRHWRAIKGVQSKNFVSISTVSRIIIFSIFRVLAAFACITVLTNPIRSVESENGIFISLHFAVSTWVDIFQASIPLVGFLVLGITRDMLDALMFWFRNRDSGDTIHQSQSSSIGRVQSPV